MRLRSSRDVRAWNGQAGSGPLKATAKRPSTESGRLGRKSNSGIESAEPSSGAGRACSPPKRVDRKPARAAMNGSGSSNTESRCLMPSVSFQTSAVVREPSSRTGRNSPSEESSASQRRLLRSAIGDAGAMDRSSARITAASQSRRLASGAPSHARFRRSASVWSSESSPPRRSALRRRSSSLIAALDHLGARAYRSARSGQPPDRPRFSCTRGTGGSGPPYRGASPLFRGALKRFGRQNPCLR